LREVRLKKLEQRNGNSCRNSRNHRTLHQQLIEKLQERKEKLQEMTPGQVLKTRKEEAKCQIQGSDKSKTRVIRKGKKETKNIELNLNVFIDSF
jgi:hypothetical protein